MPTFKIDIHIHTDHSDATATFREVVLRAKERGLDGIAITDHMTIDAFKDAPQIVEGVLVVPGVEVETKDGHLIVLGVKAVPPRRLSFAEVVGWAHQCGCLVIVAHPRVMGFSVSVKAMEKTKPDAIETLNAKVPFKRNNLRSVELAEQRGLPQTGGSDSHSADTVGDAYTVVYTEELSVEGVLRAIKEGRVAPEGRLSGLYSRFSTAVHGIPHAALHKAEGILHFLSRSD